MNTRSIKARLSRLELAVVPVRLDIFVLWAADEAGIRTEYERCKAAGLVTDRDPIIAGVWPWEGRPASRWATSEETTDDEVAAMAGYAPGEDWSADVMTSFPTDPQLRFVPSEGLWQTIGREGRKDLDDLLASRETFR